MLNFVVVILSVRELLHVPCEGDGGGDGGGDGRGIGRLLSTEKER